MTRSTSSSGPARSATWAPGTSTSPSPTTRWSDRPIIRSTYGIANLPGLEPGSSASFIGGDLVVIPQGSERVDDAVAFMKFILSDNEQVEGYAKLLNLTTRSDMADNEYFQDEPLVQDVAKALEVGQTPYTLTFFEQINDPAGPWLQMLQRVYYTDDDLDTVIADAKTADEGDLLPGLD